jgi:hypothetical protein
MILLNIEAGSSGSNLLLVSIAHGDTSDALDFMPSRDLEATPEPTANDGNPQWDHTRATLSTPSKIA